MKKVSNVTLGGVIFTVEEDAYAALGAYLDGVQRHFASFPERDEIVADIESRIAEKFTAAVSARKHSINMADVEEVIRSMGSVADFADAAPATPASAPSAGTAERRTRLYRNVDDQIIGGVGSGVAAYFGVDPTIVRLVMFIIIFFGGFGFLLYLVLWLIVPAAKTEAEKLEMRGEPVTIAALEAQLKERVEDVRNRDHGWLRRVLSFPIVLVKAVLRFLGRLVPFVVRILGLVISLIAIALSIALSVAFVTALLSPANAFDVDLSGVLAGAPYYTLVAAGFLALFLPLLALILLGSSMLKDHNLFSGGLVTGLVVLWIAALSVGGAVGIRFAPQLAAEGEAALARETRTQEFPLALATRITAKSDASITVVHGDTFRVTALGLQRDLEHLELTSTNSELRIARKATGHVCLFCSSHVVQITVETPDLDALTVEGSANIRLENFTGDALAIQTQGSSDIDAYVTLDALTITGYGSSDVRLHGTATALALETHGSADVDASELATVSATLRLDGSSDVELEVRDMLDVKIDGSGTVRYTGDPQVRKEISGSGDVERIERAPE